MTYETINANRFLTVRQVAEAYPAFTMCSIRWLIFNQKTNGFGRCVKRLGRKILIDTQELNAWVSEQSAEEA